VLQVKGGKISGNLLDNFRQRGSISERVLEGGVCWVRVGGGRRAKVKQGEEKSPAEKTKKRGKTAEGSTLASQMGQKMGERKPHNGGSRRKYNLELFLRTKLKKGRKLKKRRSRKRRVK